MYINQYGNLADPVIILMAPLMVSGEEFYRYISPAFQGDYHMIAPDQGGTGKAGSYISLEYEYAHLKDFLLGHEINKIALAYGASLGASIAYRLFTDPDFHVLHAWLDGAVLNQNAGLAQRYMNSMFKNQQKRLKGSSNAALPSLVKMYGPDFARIMTGNLKRLTQKDVDAISYTMCHCDLVKLSDKEQRKIHLDYGEKDFGLQYSKKAIPVYMPKAELVIRKGYEHCGYMAAHMKQYVEQVELFMKRD